MSRQRCRVRTVRRWKRYLSTRRNILRDRWGIVAGAATVIGATVVVGVGIVTLPVSAPIVGIGILVAGAGTGTLVSHYVDHQDWRTASGDGCAGALMGSGIAQLATAGASYFAVRASEGSTAGSSALMEEGQAASCSLEEFKSMGIAKAQAAGLYPANHQTPADWGKVQQWSQLVQQPGFQWKTFAEQGDDEKIIVSIADDGATVIWSGQHRMLGGLIGGNPVPPESMEVKTNLLYPVPYIRW
jgi:hypothetical protein